MMSGPEDGGAFRPEGEPALFDSDLRVDDPEPTAAAVVDGKAAVPFLSSSSSSEAAAAARPNQDDAGGQETDELREANLPEAVCRHHPDQDDDDDDDNKAGGRCQADTALAADDAQVAPGPTRKISCDDATPNVKRRRSMREKNRLVVNKASLFYRRMQELFFHQAESLGASQSDADMNSSCDATSAIQGSTGCGTRKKIGNWVLRQVHAEPNIYVIDNFLNRSDLEYFRVRIRTGTFQRSYVDGSTIASRRSSRTNCEGSATLPEEHIANQDDENKPVENSAGVAQDQDPTSSAGKRKALAFVDREHRTSTFLSFDKQQDSKIAAIEKRASELMGCWSSVPVEPLQLVRYTEGQFFNVHHDLADYNDETGHVELPPKSLFFRRRVVTLFCYLNEVEEGGETAFPACPVTPASPIHIQDDSKHTSEQDDGETIAASDDAQPSGSLPNPIDSGAASATPSSVLPQPTSPAPAPDAFLKVQPKPGRAVLWSNVLEDGNPDPRTIHAGLPVRRGTKYGINVWICEG